ncbi:hypothetical protein GYA49_04635 [Candidatus Beckwithbacteria bacterium]|nr:hypothetical protein [Candidatus Beckwithbacteria bacterium]
MSVAIISLLLYKEQLDFSVGENLADFNKPYIQIIIQLIIVGVPVYFQIKKEVKTTNQFQADQVKNITINIAFYRAVYAFGPILAAYLIVFNPMIESLSKILGSSFFAAVIISIYAAILFFLTQKLVIYAYRKNNNTMPNFEYPRENTPQNQDLPQLGVNNIGVPMLTAMVYLAFSFISLLAVAFALYQMGYEL